MQTFLDQERVLSTIFSSNVSYQEICDNRSYYLSEFALGISLREFNQILAVYKEKILNNFETRDQINLIIDFLKDKGITILGSQPVHRHRDFHYKVEVSHKIYGNSEYHLKFNKSPFGQVLKVKLNASNNLEMVFFLHEWEENNWKCLDSVADCLYRALLYELKLKYEYEIDIRERGFE